MTVQELHTNFRLHVDRLDGQFLADYEPEEIDNLLNTAQLRFIKTRYGKNNIYQKGYEETQKRTDDLKDLVSYFIVKPDVLSEEKVYYDFTKLYNYISPTTLADKKYLYYLTSRVETRPTDIFDCNNERIVCDYSYKGLKIIQSDDISKVLIDPFNKPNSEFPVGLFYFTGLIVFLNKYEVRDLELMCIFVPDKISLSENITSNLSENVHDEIVSIAVQIALETIESKRTESYSAVTKNTLE